MRRRLIALLSACALSLWAACAGANAACAPYPYYDGEAYILVDESGRTVAGEGGDYVHILPVVSDTGLQRFIAFAETGVTLLDECGQALTDGKFDSMYEQDGALMTVRGELTGVISWDGDEILPPKYATIAPTGEGTYLTSTDDPNDGIVDEIYLTREDGSSTYLNLSAADISRFSEGLVSAQARNGKYGYLNSDGQWAIAPVYDWADGFRDGKAVVTRGGYAGLIDRSGTTILPARFDSIVSSGCDDKPSSAIVAITGGTATIYDSATLMPVRTVDGVSYAYLPGFDLAVLASEDGCAVYNSLGEALLRTDGQQYLEILSADRAIILSDEPGQSRVVDMRGNTVLDDISYAYSLYDGDTPYAICVSRDAAAADAHSLADEESDAYDNAIWGVYSLDGDELLPMEYDEISAVCADVFAVRQGEYTGLVRSGGEWILRTPLTGETDG